LNAKKHGGTLVDRVIVRSIETLAWSAIIIAILLAGGCAAPTPQLGLGTSFSISQYNGAPLSGPTTQPADWSNPSSAIIVDAHVYALEAATVSGLSPVVSQARLIVRSPTDQPLLPTTDLTNGFGWATGSAADQIKANFTSGNLGASSTIAQTAIAIPSGATAVLAIGNPDAPPVAGTTTGVRILFHCPEASQFEPAVAAAGLMADATGADLEPRIAAELSVLPTVSLAKPTSCAMFIPFNFSDIRFKGLLILLTASAAEPTSPQWQTLMRQSQNLLAQSAKSLTAGSQLSLSDLMYWSALQVGVSGLSDPVRRRASLSYLSARVGASICEDFVLVANEENLAKLALMVQPKLTAAELTGSRAAAQWALDGSAMQIMTQLQDAGKLPPELLSVLVRTTGELGMDPGSLEDILADSRDTSDFQIRITAENFNYLEDNSPAARARAFEWLTEHNAAPPGYDPLGSRDDREAALEKAYDNLSQTSGGTQ
jgi:hypothetical protein